MSNEEAKGMTLREIVLIQGKNIELQGEMLKRHMDISEKNSEKIFEKLNSVTQDVAVVKSNLIEGDKRMTKHDERFEKNEKDIKTLNKFMWGNLTTGAIAVGHAIKHFLGL